MRSRTRPSEQAEQPATDDAVLGRCGGWVIPAGGLIAAGVVVTIALWAGAGPYLAFGDTDPGPVVHLGAPLLRLVADLAATVCVGSLVFAVCFTDSPPAGELCARGCAAVGSAGGAAAVWCVAALVLVPFEVAEDGGGPLLGGSGVAVSPQAGPLELLAAMEEPLAWLVAAGLALLVTMGCAAVALGFTVRWRWAVGVLGLAVLTVLAPLTAGHSSSGIGHDLATAAIIIHVPAAVVWVGVLIALLRAGGRDPALAAEQVRRYRRLALGCWVVVAASGLVDAVVLAPPGRWLGTGYGRLVLGTAALTAVLGLVGVRLRRLAARRVTQGVVGRGMLALAAGEAVVLAATMGVSVVLAHLAPPGLLEPVTNTQEMLGYDLAGPPTLARLALDWRVDVLFGPLAVALAGVYVLGVRRLRRRGTPWPAARTVAWLCGCVVLLLATSSGIGRYAAGMFSVHMASHMLLAMLVPVLLVLGGPLTLLRAAVPPAEPGGLAGPREWVEALAGSSVARVVTHPVIVLVLFAGAPFAVYFTPVFDAAARFHWAHMLLNLVFLVIGLLFAWVTVGVDPTPRPLPVPARVGVLLAAMPFDAVFAALVTNSPWVIGNGPAGYAMYSSLALPWTARTLLADQHTAGAVALGLGELALVIAVAASLLRWAGVRALIPDSAPDGQRPGQVLERLLGARARR